MDTIMATAAAVTGARHLRAARNGQDAAASWVGGGAGAIVVCDGCGAGGSSEVGARLGAQLVIAAVAARLARGERPSELWSGVRAQVGERIAGLAAAMAGDRDRDREAALREHFLFTVVAAAVARDEACVWAIGDGAYGFGERVQVLGPFPDNQPPYLAYDLLGMAQPAHVEVADLRAGAVMIATDGAAELGPGLRALLAPATLDHPDGLRRRLAVLARGGERIDWEARRIARTPAALQDDGAVAVLRWRP